MRRRFSSLAAVLSVALVATLASAKDSRAAVLFFDDFNSESQSLNHSTFANWSVSAGFVDVIGTASFDFYPGNGNYVDLNGSNGVNGTLTSNTVFGAGTYTLTFLLGGSQGGAGGVDLPNPKTTLVTLGNFSQEITLAPDAGLTSQSFTFTTTGGNLIFTSLSGGNADVGNILDNVQVASAIPEPSTWAMMLIGFGGIGLLAYRRSKKTIAATAAI
jgi:hypothetical protein